MTIEIDVLYERVDSVGHESPKTEVNRCTLRSIYSRFSSSFILAAATQTMNDLAGSISRT